MSSMSFITCTRNVISGLLLLAIPFSGSAQQVPLSEKVKADLATQADRTTKTVYFRVATPQDDGSYTVEVTDKRGVLRMTGRYLDEKCTVADGPFTYYYHSASVESTGNYDNGLKTGTWICYRENGTPRAERNYSGMSWEDLAISLGLASRAASLGQLEDQVR